MPVGTILSGPLSEGPHAGPSSTSTSATGTHAVHIGSTKREIMKVAYVATNPSAAPTSLVLPTVHVLNHTSKTNDPLLDTSSLVSMSGIKTASFDPNSKGKDSADPTRDSSPLT